MSRVEPISTLDGAQPSQGNSQFSAKDKRDELAREINMRKTVYPGMIRAGRLTAGQAERQRAIMTEIWQEYSAKADVEAKERKSQPIDQPTSVGVDPAKAGDDRTTRRTVAAGGGDGEIKQPAAADSPAEATATSAPADSTQRVDDRRSAKHPGK